MFLVDSFTLLVYGAESRIRTGDPFLFREMLYQLSYLGLLSARQDYLLTRLFLGMIAHQACIFTL
jgi:hypothetical protein